MQGPCKENGQLLLKNPELRNLVLITIVSFFFKIYLFLAALVLRCCVWLSLVAAGGGYSLSQCVGFSLQWLLIAEHWLYTHGFQ